MKKVFFSLLLLSTIAKGQNAVGILKFETSEDLKNFTTIAMAYSLTGDGRIVVNSNDTLNYYPLSSRFNILGTANNSELVAGSFAYTGKFPDELDLSKFQTSTSNAEVFPILGVSSSLASFRNFLGSTNPIVGVDSITKGTAIRFSGYTDRNEIIYQSKDEISGYEFYNHELLSKDGTILTLEKTQVSAMIYPLLGATSGNGAYTVHQASYGEGWQAFDGIDWAKLSAPTNSQAVSFALTTTANGATGNRNGAFVINTGTNSLSFKTVGTDGVIGWDDPSFGTLILNAKVIQTDAQIIQTGVYKTNTAIAVSNTDDLTNLSVNENIQGYFFSNRPGNTGLQIGNLNSDPNTTAGITIQQQGVSNWIRTISATSNSDFYLPGSLSIEGRSPGGILIATTSPFNSFGPIRFAINQYEIGRFIEQSFVIGTDLEDPSLIFNVESNSRASKPIPTMTSQERKKIKNPKAGSQVYDITINELCIFNGKRWKKIKTEDAD